MCVSACINIYVLKVPVCVDGIFLSTGNAYKLQTRNAINTFYDVAMTSSFRHFSYKS